MSFDAEVFRVWLRLIVARMFASRSSSSTEDEHAQLERAVALAIVWGYMQCC